MTTVFRDHAGENPWYSQVDAAEQPNFTSTNRLAGTGVSAIAADLPSSNV